MITFRRYFEFKGEQADDHGVHIHTLGHHIHSPNTAYPDVSHPESHYFNWENGRNLSEYQLLYIAKGRGVFEAAGLPSQGVQAGTIILLYPDIWHRYKPLEETGWEEYWVGFSGGYAQHLLEQECFSPKSPIIELGLNYEIEASFERILGIVESKDEAQRKLASFLLIQLLGIVYTSVLIFNQKLSKKERIIEDIKKGINAKWNENVDFEALAEHQNVSYSWLRKAFKDITGTSLNQYQLMIQLRNAEQMIQKKEQTLGEIASNCGFESIHYFSRIFKQKLGYLPSEARRKWG